jgi:hypothetical protein
VALARHLRPRLVGDHELEPHLPELDQPSGEVVPGPHVLDGDRDVGLGAGEDVLLGHREPDLGRGLQAFLGELGIAESHVSAREGHQVHVVAIDAERRGLPRERLRDARSRRHMAVLTGDALGGVRAFLPLGVGHLEGEAVRRVIHVVTRAAELRRLVIGGVGGLVRGRLGVIVLGALGPVGLIESVRGVAGAIAESPRHLVAEIAGHAFPGDGRRLLIGDAGAELAGHDTDRAVARVAEGLQRAVGGLVRELQLVAVYGIRERLRVHGELPGLHEVVVTAAVARGGLEGRGRDLRQGRGVGRREERRHEQRHGQDETPHRRRRRRRERGLRGRERTA